MNESERLADQLTKALNGEAWHGPSWRDVLGGLGREAAVHRPIPQAHSIAEILLHTTTWLDVVRRRLLGDSPQVTQSEDWPEAAFQDDVAWSAAVARLFDSGVALVETVRGFSPEKLNEKRPGSEGTWYALVIGELQHLLYHAGQVGLLAKARVPATV